MENKNNNNNSLAILSFIFGVFSMLLFFSAAVNDYAGMFGSAIGIGLGITAIVLGSKYKKKYHKSGLSVAGVVTGIIGICVCAFCFLGCSSNRIYVSSIGENYTNTKTREEELRDSMLELIELEKSMCKDKYEDISYSSLSRTPDNYKDNCIHFTGEVIQVLEDFDDNTAQLRVNTKKTDYDYIENYYIDDTIYVYVYNYNRNNRILEDDIIDLYGKYDGIVTYESIMGAKISIPSMIAHEYSIK